MNTTYKEIIENYIRAYNDFDINNMLKDMDDAVIFKNISDGKVTLEIKGVDMLKNQAHLSAAYFKSRQQSINQIKFETDTAEVIINYHAVLAKDIPDGPKAGTEINLVGKSIFRFKDGKIFELSDIQ